MNGALQPGMKIFEYTELPEGHVFAYGPKTGEAFLRFFGFRVSSAKEWTASVHTLHMSKPVIAFVFKALRNGLLRYILYTCPTLHT